MHIRYGRAGIMKKHEKKFNGTEPWRTDLSRICAHFSRYAEWWILGLGVFLRLKHFFENNSLWLDESWVAASAASRSFGEILFHRQIMPEFPEPPTVFFLIEKAFLSAFGNNEMALRFFPLLAGIVGLGAFFFLSRKILSRRDSLLALTLFSIAEPLVYYSAEVKQYSSDLCAAVFLFLFADHCLRFARIRGREIVFLALIGAGVVWISYPSIIVLLAIALLFFIRFFVERDRKLLGALAAAVLCWFSSFWLLYKVSLGAMDSSAPLKGMWKGAMLASSLVSFETFSWLGRILNAAFQDPLSFAWPVIGWALFSLGVFSFWQNDRGRTILFLLPVVITLVAAMAGKYPFQGRMLLFLVPSGYIFISSGFGFLVDRSGRWKRFAVGALLVVILISPVSEALAKFSQGRSRADNRQALQFLQDHFEAGDFIYMNTSAQPPFWYYAGSLGLGEMFPQQVFGVYKDGPQKAMKIGKFGRFTGEDESGKFLAFRYEYNSFDDHGLFQGTFGFNYDKLNFGKVPVGGSYQYPASGRTWLFLSAGDDYDNELNAMILDSFDQGLKRSLFYEGKNAAVYLYDIPVPSAEKGK